MVLCIFLTLTKWYFNISGTFRKIQHILPFYYLTLCKLGGAIEKKWFQFIKCLDFIAKQYGENSLEDSNVHINYNVFQCMPKHSNKLILIHET